MIRRSCSRTLGLLTVLVLGLCAGPALAQGSLSIENETAQGLTTEMVDVSLSTTNDVEGFVLAIGYDTMAISVIDITIAGTVTDTAGAELVVPEIFEAQGGVTLGVVLDAEAPFGGQTIPAPGGVIARLQVMPDMVVAAPTTVGLNFTDGTFNNPPLDNIVVEGGLSIGVGQGLVLNNGSLVLQPPAPDQLTIESVTTPGNQVGCARVLLDLSSGPAQGFVLAIGHDPAVVDLVDINLSGTVAQSVGAEFVVPNLNPTGGTGGTVGVVLDFDPPFGGQTIAPGNGLHIANFCYSCVNPVVVTAGDPIPAPVCGALEFVNNTLGSPALDNVVVVAGLSLTPATQDGEICCEPIVVAAEDSAFYCGVEDANGNVVDATAIQGETIELCFFYSEGTDNGTGCLGENVQGLQMALTFDCNLSMIQGSFDTSGTILEAVGAEFVTHSVDNDPNDGDGCELTIGVLLDAVPPFQGQTAPPSCDPLRIGCIDVVVADDAPCNSALSIAFTNFVNGAESVPIENILVIGNRSVQSFNTFDCAINVVAERSFVRGDCNTDSKVDLADASSVLAQQFQNFPVQCLDACDSNDDGKINLADTVFLLNYLFDSGPIPPAPGPDLNQGTDPTEDNLSCLGGTDSCNP